MVRSDSLHTSAWGTLYGLILSHVRKSKEPALKCGQVNKNDTQSYRSHGHVHLVKVLVSMG